MAYTQVCYLRLREYAAESLSHHSTQQVEGQGRFLKRKIKKPNSVVECLARALSLAKAVLKRRYIEYAIH